MPLKSEKIKLPPHLDKRRKLTLDQVEAIKVLNEQGYSYQRLADMFGCSKSSIQNIIKPQPRSAQKKRPTEYCTKKKREYRKRKQALFLSGHLHEEMSNAEEPVKVEKFIHLFLTLAGLERGKDYTIRPCQLRIRKFPVRGKLLDLLKEYYPLYNYYWETPKILRWF